MDRDTVQRLQRQISEAETLDEKPDRNSDEERQLTMLLGEIRGGMSTITPVNRTQPENTESNRQVLSGHRQRLYDQLANQPAGRRIKPTDPSIDMTERETKRYCLAKIINAACSGDYRHAGFELEVSRAYADRCGKPAKGFYIPPDVLSAPRFERRDLLVGTNSAGGYTRQTDLISFIDMLRNRLITVQAGAQLIPDLVGNVAIPRQSAGATAYWVAENSALTESQQTFEQATATPKTVGAFTDISRRLLAQSSVDMLNLVETDLNAVLARAVDLAALHGTGASNQPTGIAATSGIGDVAGGTNGLAPTFAHLVALESEVANDNGDVGSLSYITNSKVRGKLKGTAKVASTDSRMIWEGDNLLNGYNAHVSNQVSSALTKGSSSGVCSAIFYGNWADLLICQWGGLDILVDPYSGGTAGTVRVIAFLDVDIVVRHPESFAAMLDALTA